ncbi:MAG: DNA repair protein RecN [Clostridia bacterium]|nr:DNA repair protein RecN [Clostridia bacterium]
MLAELTVKNVATIEEIRWSLRGGFTALTGETGAGKSILIDSVQMLLGEKTSKDIIRHGAEKASVEGVFTDIDTETENILSELGITPEEDKTLIIRRELTAEGRSVCRINGKAATLSSVKEIGRRVVNMHGQHENQLLLDEGNHLNFLDNYANTEIEKEKYLSCYRSLIEIKKKINKFNETLGEKQRRISYLNDAVSELSALNLKEGEEKELMSAKAEVANAEKINAAVSDGYTVLISGENSVCDRLYGIKSEISSLEKIKPSFKELAERLESLITEAKDIASELNAAEIGRSYMSIDALEDRLELIRRTKIKYNMLDADGLIKFKSDAESEIEELTNSEETAAALKDEYRKKLSELEDLAKALREKRKRLGAELDKRIIDELSYLDMNKVRFVTEISDLTRNGKRSYSDTGGDAVRFLISANVGEEPKPLAKIASGGEISRLMLAVKAVMADKIAIPTLIFDEIDTGVSGKTASKIGSKMKQISDHAQVICVTHLAQIAAKANNQYKITKTAENGRSYSNVNELTGEARVEELARIIGGETITEAAKATAKELMEN